MRGRRRATSRIEHDGGSAHHAEQLTGLAKWRPRYHSAWPPLGRVAIADLRSNGGLASLADAVPRYIATSFATRVAPRSIDSHACPACSGTKSLSQRAAGKAIARNKPESKAPKLPLRSASSNASSGALRRRLVDRFEHSMMNLNFLTFLPSRCRAFRQ